MRRSAIVLSFLALASCEGTTFQCDPTLSWSTPPPMAPPDAGDGTCGAACLPSEVVAGADHTCVRLRGSAVVCFGDDEHGQSDPDRAGEREVPPTLVYDDEPTSLDFAPTLAAGSGATCATSAGGLTCWGHPAITGGASGLVQVIDGTTVTPRMAALHGCALTVRLDAGERVPETRCFGAWDGRDPAAGPAHPPVAVGDALSMIAIGGFRSCDLRGREPWCRGGDPPDGALVAGPWNAPPSTEADASVWGPRSLAVGADRACYVTEAATEIVCGWAASGFTWELGGEWYVNSLCVGGAGPIETRDGVLASSPRSAFVCALYDGQVLCRGANERGQLGQGTTDPAPPGPVVGLEDVRAIACGGAHACAIASGEDGFGVYCWGANDHGQLGAPSSALVASSTPIAVSSLPTP